jgi:hypothetical protein
MHTLKNEYAYDIDEIIETFEFEKVHSVMCQLDWRWFNEHGLMQIPSQTKLITTAYKLLHDAAKGACQAELKRYITATGGFWAEAEIVNEKMYLELSFRIDAINNFD